MLAGLLLFTDLRRIGVFGVVKFIGYLEEQYFIRRISEWFKKGEIIVKGILSLFTSCFFDTWC